jgi:hypothetical protein
MAVQPSVNDIRSGSATLFEDSDSLSSEQVFTGPCVLLGVAITASSAGSERAVVYDNTAASGTDVIEIRAAASDTQSVNLWPGIRFSTGIRLATGGATQDWVAVWYKAV